MDGQPLVLIAGTNLAPGAQYRTYIERYRRIEIKGTSADLWFEVKMPDGSVAEYGNTASSRVNAMDQNTTTPYFQWSINQVTDAFGNLMTYDYHLDTLAGINYPLSISYANAEVEFVYTLRDDAITPVNLGSVQLEQMVQLNTINVRMNSLLIRDYRFDSEPISGSTQRRLTQLQQCGYDESGASPSCLEPLLFDWIDPAQTLPELSTLLSKVTDSLGAVTEFTHDFIVEGSSNGMLFSEEPFGAGLAPANANALSGARGEALKCVVTQLKRDNGIGGTNTTNYAYQGPGFDSTENWGFLGFYAQRITDNASGVVTYLQTRLDHPYLGRVSATHQYDNSFGSHTEILSKTESAFSTHTFTAAGGQTNKLPFSIRNTEGCL